MKKLLSLCLTVVMMACLLAGVTVNAAGAGGSGGAGGGGATPGTPEYEYYYFSYANLVDRTIADNASRTDLKLDHIAYPAPTSTSRLYPVNAKWYNDTPGGNAAVGAIGADGLVNYDVHSGNYYMAGAEIASTGKTRTIDVYVKAPGVYTIWALVPHKNAPSWSQETVPPSSTSFHKFTGTWNVAVNGGTAQELGNEEYDYNSADNVQTVTRYGGSYTEYKNSFYWDKVTAELVAGKNEITIGATNTNTNMSALFVTNDNARPSTKFAYIGTYEAWSTGGQGGNAYWCQNIKYFGDGQYHANWQADGFINLREYSDLDAPTLAIDEVGAVVTDNTITFDWTANDPKREYVGRIYAYWNGVVKNDNSGNPALVGYVGDGVNPSTFYADASGIYETRIYENDVLIATFNDDTSTYTYDAPFTGSSYNFKVEVVDHFGNIVTDSAIFTTTGPADTEAPVLTGEIEVANASFGSTITWPAATDNTQVLGYEIYEDAIAPENLVELVTNVTTSYTFDLNPGESKDIIVVAKDRVGLYSAPLNATIQSLAGTENFLLRKENFDMPDPALRIWDLANISSAMIERGCLTLTQGANTGYARGRTLEAKSANAEVTAKIWVDTPGEYTAFIHMNQAGYGVHLAMNGERTETPFGARAELNDAGATIYKWEKASRTWNLEAGWNEVKLISTTTAGSLSVIYITNGTTVEANELTYRTNDSTTVIDNGKLNTAIYEDIAGPTFAAGDVAVAYDSVANAAAITWPAATDAAELVVGSSDKYMVATGLQSYKVYVNDKEIAALDNATTTFTINETTLGRALVPGEVIKIKVEALDVCGNKNVKELSYEISKFVITSFNIKNSTGVADSLLLLNDGTVQAELVVKNISEAAADVRLAIAIYDATGNLLFGDEVDHTVAADAANDTVTATISGAPTDLTGCTVKAHLWHAGNLSPASTQWTTIKIQ